jgi:hypothetical protein
VIAGLLAFIVRLLPDREWGRAMQAELTVVEGGRARLRFVLGCVRAVLTNARVLRGFATLTLAYALAGGAAGLYFAAPNGGDWPGAIIFALVFVEGTAVVARRFAVVLPLAVTGAALWWLGLLASATVRAHGHWSLVVISLCAFVAWRRHGETEALATGLATSLAIFVATVGTYVALPLLAPEVVPANAANRVLENQIESVDPYITLLLLAGFISLALGARRRLDRLPG